MTVTQLFNAIRSRFKEQIADLNPLIPIEYDNAPPLSDDSKRSNWMRVTVLPGEAQLIEIGTTKRTRQPGVLSVGIFAPLGYGDAIVNSLADSVVSAFRTVTADNVVYGVPYPTNVGRTGSHYQISVTCPFHADHVA